MKHLKNWLDWLLNGIDEYGDDEFKDNLFNDLGCNCFKTGEMLEFSKNLKNKFSKEDDITSIVEKLSKEMKDLQLIWIIKVVYLRWKWIRFL